MLEIRKEASTSDLCSPSHLSMTTITYTFKLDTDIDVDAIRTRLQEAPFVIRRKGSSHEGTAWKIKENKFFNQVTVEYVDDFSKKSIKFFPNGSIHVTGCADPLDCERVVAQVKFFVSQFTHKPVNHHSARVLMINTNFSMNALLNLAAVSKTAEASGCSVSFKPEIYSAVKIKFFPGKNMKRVTASVFSSGCVLITGAQTLDEVVESYGFLTRTLAGTCVRAHITQKDFSSFAGITFENWKKHLLAPV